MIDRHQIENSKSPELTVVMPCLNEADTLATCIGKAQIASKKSGIDCQIIVADNGSDDGSDRIAEECGADLIRVAGRGYGNALMAGIAAAQGKYILMADADDSYDFLELPKFVQELRKGYDLVQGCRFPSGGGSILKGAMPFLHRWVGNPLFSLLVRWWFRAPIHDVYCGMRGFTPELYKSLGQRCTGMEFATEMIIKSSLQKAKIKEVPIILHPDGRTSHKPHLKTFRDGWRTIRYFLMCSPRWLFLNPGYALLILGLIGYALALPGVRIGRATLDAHTLLFASVAILTGYQSILFALFTKTFAVNDGLLPSDERFSKFMSIFNLELGIFCSALALAGGLVLLGGAVNQWRAVDYGPLDYSYTMKWVVPGVTITAIAFQTLLSSFMLSILRMAKK